ncbi:hypothetical protein D3C72_1657990 [compost metagenome]
MPAAGQVTLNWPLSSVLSLSSSSLSRYWVLPAVTVTSRSLAGLPSRCSVKVAFSPLARSVGLPAEISSRPWPMGLSAEGLPTVTKVSMRPADWVMVTSCASAGISLAMVSAVPRARLFWPVALSFQAANAPLLTTAMR